MLTLFILVCLKGKKHYTLWWISLFFFLKWLRKRSSLFTQVTVFCKSISWSCSQSFLITFSSCSNANGEIKVKCMQIKYTKTFKIYHCWSKGWCLKYNWLLLISLFLSFKIKVREGSKLTEHTHETQLAEVNINTEWLAYELGSDQLLRQIKPLISYLRIVSLLLLQETTMVTCILLFPSYPGKYVWGMTDCLPFVLIKIPLLGVRRRKVLDHVLRENFSSLVSK